MLQMTAKISDVARPRTDERNMPAIEKLAEMVCASQIGTRRPPRVCVVVKRLSKAVNPSAARTRPQLLQRETRFKIFLQHADLLCVAEARMVETIFMGSEFDLPRASHRLVHRMVL